MFLAHPASLDGIEMQMTIPSVSCSLGTLELCEYHNHILSIGKDERPIHRRQELEEHGNPRGHT